MCLQNVPSIQVVLFLFDIGIVGLLVLKGADLTTGNMFTCCSRGLKQMEG